MVVYTHPQDVPYGGTDPEWKCIIVLAGETTPAEFIGERKVAEPSGDRA
jgi:hypothetical protein